MLNNIVCEKLFKNLCFSVVPDIKTLIVPNCKIGSTYNVSIAEFFYK